MIERRPGALSAWKDEDPRFGMPDTPAHDRRVGHGSCPLVPPRGIGYWHVDGTRSDFEVAGIRVICKSLMDQWPDPTGGAKRAGQRPGGHRGEPNPQAHIGFLPISWKKARTNLSTDSEPGSLFTV